MSNHYIRKIIRIRAEDSPNVQYALKQQELGLPVTNEIILPGVLSWEEYQLRRKTWDKVRQCISLDGEFYEGADALMFPPDWLRASGDYAARLGYGWRPGRAMGIDTAEGGDNTCVTVVDEKGIIKQVSKKTPDTSIIPGWILGVMDEYKIHPKNVMFDRGGGGHQHADRLKAQGYPVRRVSFGEGPSEAEGRSGLSFSTLDMESSTRHTFKNLRAEMYWNAREMITPSETGEVTFGIPLEYSELCRQLSALYIYYDEEGRIYLPPKRHKSTAASTRTQSIEDILGCSPDEADSFVLAVHALGGRKTAYERKEQPAKRQSSFSGLY